MAELFPDEYEMKLSKYAQLDERFIYITGNFEAIDFFCTHYSIISAKIAYLRPITDMPFYWKSCIYPPDFEMHPLDDNLYENICQD